MDFRQVTEQEIGAAYGVYLEVLEWLKAKGVRQWLQALPEEEFVRRQARGELLACFLESRVAGIVTVAFEEDPDWAECVGTGRNWWIKTLAVSRAHRDKGLGERMMEASEAHSARFGAKVVYLECVDGGFLPGYYAQSGYEALKSKRITYPSGNTFQVALMRKSLTEMHLAAPGLPTGGGGA